MTHIEKANDLFGRKFHCSQAVFAAFAEELGLTEEQALKIGACFGSGMRKGEVCGACTGALMALGLKYGQSNEDDMDSRLKTNEVTDRFMTEFEEENGCVCNENSREYIERIVSCPRFPEFSKNLGRFLFLGFKLFKIVGQHYCVDKTEMLHYNDYTFNERQFNK